MHFNDLLIESNTNSTSSVVYDKFHSNKTRIIIFYRCFSVIFIIIGTLCNLLTAFIYSKKRMRQTSYSIYLLVLAFVDLSITWVGNMRFAWLFFNIDLTTQQQQQEKQQVINVIHSHNNETMDTIDDDFYWDLYFTSGLDFRESSIIVCRLHRFLNYFLLQFSSLLLCLLSIDRFVGVVLSLKSSLYCTVYFAKRVIIITGLFLFLFNSHFLISMGYHEIVSTNNNATFNQTSSTSLRVICEANPEHKFYSNFWKIYIWLDGLTYAIIPFIIMIVCNFFLIRKMISSRFRSNLVVMSEVKRNDTLRVSRVCRAGSVVSTSGMLPTERRVSIIFLIISFSFLIFTIPISITEVIILLQPRHHISATVMAFANMFMYCNHVINFFFYCAIGPKFRNEVKKLLPFSISPKNRIAPHVLTRGKTSTSNSIAKLEITSSNTAVTATATTTTVPQQTTATLRSIKMYIKRSAGKTSRYTAFNATMGSQPFLYKKQEGYKPRIFDMATNPFITKSKTCEDIETTKV